MYVRGVLDRLDPLYDQPCDGNILSIYSHMAGNDQYSPYYCKDHPVVDFTQNTWVYRSRQRLARPGTITTVFAVLYGRTGNTIVCHAYLSLCHGFGPISRGFGQYTYYTEIA